MYVSFAAKDRKGNPNSSSCKKLAKYLDKETQNEWFNDKTNDVDTKSVVLEIDKNGRGQLNRGDWKFVEIEYNPSRKEQIAIIEQATGRTDVTEWNQLSKEEQQKTKAEFQNYVIKAQTEQAINYNRENIKSAEDLKWYGKIETQRKYKGYDDEVKNGEAKSGELKQGLQMHCHIIQSRKAEDGKTKISPLSKHKGQTDKNRIQQGFDRNKFYSKVDELFDKEYKYRRELKETYEYQKANKYNRLQEKLEIEQKYNQLNNSKMENLQELHYKMSQDQEIQNFQDYKLRMEAEEVKIKEIKNEKNETIDLQLEKDNENARFTELQESLEARGNKEIESQWIREQMERQEELRRERQMQQEEQREKEERKDKGFSI